MPSRLLGLLGLLGLGVITAVGAAVAAAPAVAAGQITGDVLSITTTPGAMTVLFAASDGHHNVPIDPSSLRITLTPTAGATRSFTPELLPVAGPGGTAAAPDRAIVLAIDTSGSMDRNGYFAVAKAAAQRFVRSLPADVRVGLVAFGDPARTVLAPTADRARITAAIQALSTSGDTAMYQAIVLAGQEMRSTAVRSIVMLTDGRNDDKLAPTFDEAQARAALRSGGAGRSPIRFAGILVGHEDRTSINTIAGEQAVQVLTDTTNLPADLDSIFRQRTDDVTRQVQLRVAVPAELAGKTVRFELSALTSDRQRVAATGDKVLAPATAGAGAAPAAERGTWPVAVGTPVAVGALLALFVALSALTFLATGALAAARNEESEVIRRLAVYTLAGNRPRQVTVTEQTRLGDSALARSAVGLMSRVARTSQLERALDSRLEAAGLPLRTAEWMVLHIGAAVGTSLIFLLVGRGRLTAAIVGLLLGLLLPWLVLGVEKGRRERRFLAQLPDTLQLLAGSLAVGYSLPQAMDSVVRESQPPISVEFNRALVEARLGMLPEDALDGIARRTGSQDFSWIVMAIRIQRDVGGNLAQLLTSVSDTLRERERLRRQVRALSAEGRLSGLILGALPITFLAYLVLVRPEYVAPLFGTRLGLLLLAIGALLMVVGGFWMTKVIKVDV